MIIPSEIHEYYRRELSTLGKFKEYMDSILSQISSKFNGLYISSIKSPESLTQKVESGNEIDKIIDLFRATIVVATRKEINNLIKENISKKFQIVEKIENRTKKPSDFIYDDLHLHIKYKPEIRIPGREFLEKPLELQIKTFLEHAWAKATHDIIYKGYELSWPNHRIAHQIKAMLEQSDEILAEIPEASSICPSNEYERFKEQNYIINLLNKKWDDTTLPQDRRRLSGNIIMLLEYCGESIKFLEEELNLPENRSLIEAKSLTPFQAILGLIIEKRSSQLISGLSRKPKKFFVSSALRSLLGTIPADLKEYCFVI